MIENGIEPKQLSQNRFEIPSQSKDLKYIVTSYTNFWSCTCPNYEFRHETCKHIHAITGQELTKKIQEDQKKESIFNPRLENRIACKFCGSSHILKYDKANNKQVYFVNRARENSFQTKDSRV